MIIVGPSYFENNIIAAEAQTVWNTISSPPRRGLFNNMLVICLFILRLVVRSIYSKTG